MKHFIKVYLHLSIIVVGHGFINSPGTKAGEYLSSSALFSALVDEQTAAKEDFVVVEPVLDSAYSNNPIKRVRHMLTALTGTEEKTVIHDRSLQQNGGIWKSKFLGRPTYGASAYIPEFTKELTKLEAKGQLINSWPPSVINILGPSSLINEGETSNIGRKTFAEALSTRSILNQSLPGIVSIVNDMKKKWEKDAESGETITFADDFSAITYAAICTAIFGVDGVSAEELALIRKCTDNIAKGLFSLPIDKPVLRRIPFFRRYPRAMQARRDMKVLLIEKVKERKAVIQKHQASSDKDSFESTGMLDSFLLQADTMSEDALIDFCVDNTILSIFAGYDTTASLSTNLILLLHEYATPEELAQIRSELEELDIENLSQKDIPAEGILDLVPSLKSAAYESFRYRTVVGSTFRKTTAPVTITSSSSQSLVEIPANTTIQWSHLFGSRSPALFDEPEKGCPLRFFNTHKDQEKQQKEQFPPFIFGYGKHKCPGQYLAQIEMALAMKAFLCNFDFHVEPNQNTDAAPPFLKPKSGLKLKLTARK